MTGIFLTNSAAAINKASLQLHSRLLSKGLQPISRAARSCDFPSISRRVPTDPCPEPVDVSGDFHTHSLPGSFWSYRAATGASLHMQAVITGISSLSSRAF